MSQPSTGQRVWLLLLLGVGFVGLAVVSGRAKDGTALDHRVLNWLIEHRRDGLTTAAIAITNAGSPVATTLLAALACALLWWRRRSLALILVVVATLASAAGVSTLTKSIVGAQRPPRTVQLLLEIDPSYPSGHVTGTLALLGIVAVVVGRGRSLAMRAALVAGVSVVTLVIALTRLYLGVHWLSDVVGGSLLGGAAVLVGSIVLRVVAPPNPSRGRQDDSAAPVATQVA